MVAGGGVKCRKFNQLILFHNRTSAGSKRTVLCNYPFCLGLSCLDCLIISDLIHEVLHKLRLDLDRLK